MATDNVTYLVIKFFMNSEKSSSTPHPAIPLPSKVLIHEPRANEYTQWLMDFLGAHESLDHKLDDIFIVDSCFLILSIYFFWCTLYSTKDGHGYINEISLILNTEFYVNLFPENKIFSHRRAIFLIFGHTVLFSLLRKRLKL
jgi:hypothetical protein